MPGTSNPGIDGQQVWKVLEQREGRAVESMFSYSGKLQRSAKEVEAGFYCLILLGGLISESGIVVV